MIQSVWIWQNTVATWIEGQSHGATTPWGWGLARSNNMKINALIKTSWVYHHIGVYLLVMLSLPPSFKSFKTLHLIVCSKTQHTPDFQKERRIAWKKERTNKLERASQNDKTPTMKITLENQEDCCPYMTSTVLVFTWYRRSASIKVPCNDRLCNALQSLSRSGGSWIPTTTNPPPPTLN